MGDGLSITLEVYLPFRGRRLGWQGRETVPAGTTAGELPGLLGLTEPELAVLVNGRNVPETTPLCDGDDVAVLRQAEGGAYPEADCGILTRCDFSDSE